MHTDQRVLEEETLFGESFIEPNLCISLTDSYFVSIQCPDGRFKINLKTGIHPQGYLIYRKKMLNH